MKTATTFEAKKLRPGMQMISEGGRMVTVENVGIKLGGKFGDIEVRFTEWTPVLGYKVSVR
jgi:hypothetical protein